MTCLQFTARDLADTDRLGTALAEAIPDGTTVALCGTLGAGKTRLVEAIASACGVPREEVVSPTFVLCQQYHARRTLYHLDAYRIVDDDEFLQLGVEEYFDAEAIVLIEWADRVARCLPPAHLRIEIQLAADDQREFVVSAIGSELNHVVAALRSRLD